MLENLTPQPPDKILELMALYRDDPRAEKIDLGVGVYKNAEGVTPIMRAVKAAEKQLWEVETTKTYTALAGDPGFNAVLRAQILGGAHEDRVASIATPGGTGAVRQGLELARLANRDVRVWVSAPTWPNHVTILKYLGIPVLEYTYFDDEACDVDFAGLMADFAKVAAGDVVLLHGCCHNPTGANLTMDQWREAVELLVKRGAVPFVDLAYQGFGDGLEADAAPTRLIAEKFPEALIAASCSKNFGVYRERAGILIALGDPAKKGLLQGTLNYLNRQNYSFPPDHGARLVTMILGNEALKADWMAELEEVRLNMLGLRRQLADELRKATNSDRFDFIARHRGMFSRLGLSQAQVMRLREEAGVYMVGDSRINIAGLNSETVPVLAAAIAKVL